MSHAALLFKICLCTFLLLTEIDLLGLHAEKEVLACEILSIAKFLFEFSLALSQTVARSEKIFSSVFSL